jgi:hypothetical protein
VSPLFNQCFAFLPLQSFLTAVKLTGTKIRRTYKVVGIREQSHGFEVKNKEVKQQECVFFEFLIVSVTRALKLRWTRLDRSRWTVDQWSHQQNRK